MVQIRKLGSGQLFMNILVYGAKGVGKTYFACSAATVEGMSPALVVNIEDGTATAAGLDNIDETDQLQAFEDAREVFWNLANKTDEWGKYNTVIIDSGTALQTMNILEVARSNQKGKHDFRITQQDWGDSTKMVEELLRRYKALPMHTIVTAGLREVFATDNPVDQIKRGPALVMPDFTPALSRKLMYMYDHIWCLHAENDTRTLLTRDSGPYKAKTRGMTFSQALGETVENPSLGELYELYKHNGEY